MSIERFLPSHPPKWQPTPVSLLGESHGQKSLVSPSPWGLKEADMTEQLTHPPKNTELVPNWSKCWHRFAFSRVLQSTSKSSMASHWVAKNSQFSMVHWKIGIYQWGKLIHYVRVHSVDSFSTIHIKFSLSAKVPELIFPWCPEQWWPGCVPSLPEDGWFTVAFALGILRQAAGIIQ